MKNYPNEIGELILEFDAARMFFAEEEEEEEASFVVSLKDITERKRAEEEMKKSRKFLNTIIENIPDSLYIKNRQFRFVEVNKAFCHRHRATKGEILGKPGYRETDERIFKTGKGLEIPEQHYTDAEGNQLWTHLKKVPLTDESGNVTHVLTISRDITERKKAEEQLKASLKEKEVLLQEIHHRVKNNIQVISSLLSLQSEYITEEKYRDMFQESQNRILSMSLIHEKLYQSRDFAKIDLNEYINDLVNDLFRYYGINTGNITLNINVENVYLGIDSGIPCGLIINELVTNSLKHAFPDGRKGEIKIAFSQNNENIYELFVGDNGVGIPEDLDIGNTESLGLRLVTMLVNDQLEGEIDLKRNNGTKFRIKFKGEN